jgi:hypothetical protein
VRARRRPRIRRCTPWWWRNTPFALPPFAAFLILCLVAVAVSSVRMQTVLMLFAFAFLIIGFVFLARPPRFLKPDWLVEQEQQSA